MTDLSLLIKTAKESGASQVTLPDGTVITFAAQQRAAPAEVKPEDLVAPLPALDEPTEEEVLFWSTDFYDEIQARKSAKPEREELA